MVKWINNIHPIRIVSNFLVTYFICTIKIASNIIWNAFEMVICAFTLNHSIRMLQINKNLQEFKWKFPAHTSYLPLPLLLCAKV